MRPFVATIRRLLVDDPYDDLPPTLVQKAVRYCGVSVVSVTLTQSLLLAFHGVLGWPGAVSNVLAVSIAAVPAYLLSRRWVWRQSGDHGLTSEVLPFWAMAVIGLVASTILVAWADARYDTALAVNTANIVAFGAVWVLKFFVLDRVLWSDHEGVPS